MNKSEQRFDFKNINLDFILMMMTFNFMFLLHFLSSFILFITKSDTGNTFLFKR